MKFIKNKILFLLVILLCFGCEGQKSKKCNIDEAMNFVNGLREVKKQSKFVDSISDNKKHLSFMIDSLEIKQQPYYRIKTGYDGTFHWETYTIFYINKNNCSTILVDEVISGEILSLEKWRILNKTQNVMIHENDSAEEKQITFSNLFNEGSNIRFTPLDLNKKEPKIEEFKSKLLRFESTKPEANDFNFDDLSLLINNEIFSNNERYINSNWLQYFIQKYPLKQNIINKLMNLAITQEDFSAVQILSKYYIFSQKDLNLAKNRKDYKDSLNGKLDIDEYYDPNYSKIDSILSFVKKLSSKNHVEDPDGYSNLRKDKLATSEVLQKVKSGENIEVIDNSGDWFLVKTKEGKEGYIHKSRIKSK